MSDSYEKLNKLIKFPSTIDFRVIFDATVVNALSEVEVAINSIENNGMKKITEAPRKSSNGKYVSYTIPVKVTTPENLKSLYTVIGALPCVKHII